MFYDYSPIVMMTRGSSEAPVSKNMTYISPHLLLRAHYSLISNLTKLLREIVSSILKPKVGDHMAKDDEQRGSFKARL